MINFVLLRMLLVSVIGTAPGDEASREITRGMLVSEDEASFVIKEKDKKKRKERGEQFPVGVLTVTAAVLPCSSRP